MALPSKEDVLRALSAICLPDGGGSVVSAGLVADLSAQETPGGLHVRLVMEADPDRAAGLEPVREQAQKVLESLEGISRATVVLAAHKQAPTMKKKEPEKRLPQGVACVIAVASGKGGVGKSTMAVNLAVALARKGLKVGLLDADVYGPSLPKLIGATKAEIQNEDGLLIPFEAYGVRFMSVGFLVEEDAPMIWRGPMVHGALRQMLYETAWGRLDVLLLDMPPGTGDAALSVAQMLPLAGAVIVSTPQDLALADVRKGAAMFRRVGVPILGLIENMSFFECPHCGQRTDIFGHGGAEKDAEQMGVSFLGRVPLDPLLRETSDSGRPLAASEEEGETFSRIADRLAPTCLESQGAA